MKRYISYGVIPYTYQGEKIYFLLVRKKITHHFGDFISGRYNCLENLTDLINNMVVNEVNAILTNDNLIDILKAMSITNKYSVCVDACIKFASYKRFLDLKFLQGIDIDRIMSNKPIWEFPKGRSKYQEIPVDTARRELYEEAGIRPQQVKIDKILSKHFVEKTVIHQREYISKYFVGRVLNSENDFNINNETDKYKWLAKEDCLTVLDLPKRNILTKFLTANYH